MNHFGDYLRSARGSRSLTAAAAQISCSKAYLWELEMGRVDNPGIKLLAAISRAYCIPLPALAGAWELPGSPPPAAPDGAPSDGAGSWSRDQVLGRNKGRWCVAMSPLERLSAHYKINVAGCWEWQRSIDRYGYGSFSMGGKRCLAHRAAYELLVGPIPDGLHIDHLCRNRKCVNPDHLEPVTALENTKRGDGIGTRHAGVTHCPAGHPYSGTNLYVWRGRRHCRACRNRRAAERAAA